MSSSEVSFKVDHREGYLKQLFDKKMQSEAVSGFTCTYENLEYGDFQLLFQGQIQFIFERKSIDDLIASIKDGRYNNQKARLFQAFKPTQIFYIIEGNLQFNASNDRNVKMTQSSVINTMLRDKIGCFHTRNHQETYELLLNIHRRFVEDPKKFCEPEAPREQAIVETSAHDDATKVFVGLLCQIPGISTLSASCFVERWSTFAAMYQELLALDEPARVALLSTLKVNGRKISKRIVEGIQRFLFA